MAEAVSLSISDHIAVVTIDSPPVNAMAQNVRAGLKRAFVDLRTREDVKAVVIGTNTSTLDIDEIAAVTTRPEDVVGLR